MLQTRQDLQALRAECRAALEKQKVKVLVCCGNGCVANGSLKLYDEMKRKLEEKGLEVEIELEKDPHDDAIAIKKTGCHGFCQLSPLMRIDPWGYFYTKVQLDDCDEIIEKTIKGGECIDRLCFEGHQTMATIPFYTNQTKVVLDQCGNISAESIREYLAVGGYEAFEQALFDMKPEEIVQAVDKSNLRGRGGGGFKAGTKWAQVARQKDPEKYVVCNGDEGDPGAFMDCSIMEGDPHRMIEGMMIAGVACGATKGYIYVRAEYPQAVARLRNAIEQNIELGLLGKNILGSGVDFELKINRGAGAFVCGEGSALTASIEGKRGMPRVKPPRTVEHGLFDKPTVLNNVESYANVPNIIKKGADWFLTIGTEKSPGTKAFALTGNIRNTGLIEVPMGTTLRQVIYDIGGGISGGKKFKAVQIGGPSGGCLTEKHLDMPLDFDSLKKAGAMIGSGGLVVMDEDTCMVEVARFFMNFTQSESCGKCVPCREGTKRMLEILERIVAGKGEPTDIDTLLDLAETVTATALCGLGKTAGNPIVSTIKNFREEYEEHIFEKKCRTGQCQALKKIVINPERCIGCSACSRKCPVNAISGEIKKPFVIDQEKCIKCGACIETCKFNAIEEV